MDGGAWRATVHGVAKRHTTEQLSRAHSKDISNLQNIRLKVDAYFPFALTKFALMLHFVTLTDIDV